MGLEQAAALADDVALAALKAESNAQQGKRSAFDVKNPGQAWWQMQKLSMTAAYMSSDNWKNLSMGRGIKWSGIIGTRSLAAGEEAWSRKFMPQTLNRFVGRFMGPDAAARFRKFGLFGSGGIFKNKALATMFGGADVLNWSIAPDVDKVFKAGRFPSSSYMGPAQAANPLSVTYATNPLLNESEKLAFREGMASIQSSKMQALRTLMPEHWKLARAGKAMGIANAYAEAGQIGTATALSKSFKSMARLKLLSSVGRVVNLAMWAPLAFEAGSFLTKSAAMGIGSLAQKIESGLKPLTNRTMEFGGDLPPGFFSARAATERQRGLSAMQTNMGRPLLGNEGMQQHSAGAW